MEEGEDIPSVRFYLHESQYRFVEVMSNFEIFLCICVISRLLSDE